MAELADAPALGAGSRKAMGVRVLLSHAFLALAREKACSRSARPSGRGWNAVLPYRHPFSDDIP